VDVPTLGQDQAAPGALAARAFDHPGNEAQVGAVQQAGTTEVEEERPDVVAGPVRQPIDEPFDGGRHGVVDPPEIAQDVPFTLGRISHSPVRHFQSSPPPKYKIATSSR